MTTKFKTAYGKTKRVQHISSQPSMTKQSFKNECDINNLLNKYQKTGLLEHVSVHKGDYSDLSYVQDYHTSLNQLNNAQETFNSLPSSLRKKFDNDPRQFVEFVLDPNNKDEIHALGLTTGRPSGETVSEGTSDTVEPDKGDSPPKNES